MTTVMFRIEMTTVASTDDHNIEKQGFRAYASDIGISAESNDLSTLIETIKTSTESYLGKTVEPIWLKGEIRFSSETP